MLKVQHELLKKLKRQNENEWEGERLTLQQEKNAREEWRLYVEQMWEFRLPSFEWKKDPNSGESEPAKCFSLHSFVQNRTKP